MKASTEKPINLAISYIKIWITSALNLAACPGLGHSDFSLEHRVFDQAKKRLHLVENKFLSC